MTYKINYTKDANRDLAKLAKSEPSAYRKALKLLEELKEHPKTGTGHPEALKENRAGQWSREITKKHRLVYEIHETEVIAGAYRLRTLRRQINDN